MGNKTWTTDRERQFLLDNLHRFEEASTNRKTVKFFDDFNSAYFREFPLQPDVPNVDAEVIVALKKRRLKNWFNNHSGPRNPKHRAHPYRKSICQSIRSLLRGVGCSGERPKQKLQPIQAYSALYWQPKLKVIVDAEWIAKLATEPELKTKTGAYLKYMNMRLNQLLQAESAEVKAEVERYRNRKDVRAPVVNPVVLPHEESLPKEELERLTKARLRQRVNDNLNPALEEIAKTIEEETGAPIVILAGSTAPKEGGTLQWSQVTAGETLDDGTNFFDFYPKFNANVFGPFRRFAKKCIDLDEVRRLDLRLKKDQVPACLDVDPDTEADSISNTTPVVNVGREGQPVDVYANRASLPSLFKAPTKSTADMEFEFDHLIPFESFDVDKDPFLAPHSPGSTFPGPSSLLVPTTGSIGVDEVQLSGGAVISSFEYNKLLSMAPNRQLLRNAGLFNAADVSQPRSLQQFARVPTTLPSVNSHSNVTSGMQVDRMMLDNAPAGLFPSPLRVEHQRGPLSEAVEPLIDFSTPAAQPYNFSFNFDGFDPMDLDPPSSFALNPVFQMPQAFDAASQPASVPVYAAAPMAVIEPSILSPDVQAPAPLAPVQMAVPEVPRSAPAAVASQIAPAPPSSQFHTVVPLHATTAPPTIHPAEEDMVAPPRRRPGHMSVAARPPRRNDVLENAGVPAASPVTTSTRRVLSDVTEEHSALANTTHKALLDDINVETLPAWLVPYFVPLRVTFRGETEDAIVADWLTLECEDEHRGSASKLRAAARPKALSSWVRRPFAINPPPESLDTHPFGESMRTWWISVMPKWRAPADRDWPLLRDVPSGEKWTEVRKVGTGGVFVVLLGLSWWLSGCGDKSERLLYASVLEDVAWVLKNVVKDMVAFPKRVRTERAAGVEEEAAQTLRKSSRSSRPSKRALGL